MQPVLGSTCFRIFSNREIGGALGVAILGALMNATYRAAIDNLAVLSSLPQEVVELVRSSIQSAQIVAMELPASIAGGIVSGARQAFVDGMSGAMTIGAMTMFVASIVALLILPARPQAVQEDRDSGQVQIARKPA